MGMRCSKCSREVLYSTQNGNIVWWECGCGASWQKGSDIKPPLGLMPRKIWEEKRLDEVVSAIARYLNVNRTIPREWVEEYNELTERLS
ncbi:hypothetical protein P9G84_31905 [Brevibacillus centrosporus]|uniref:hypothetical protein n=1 Tax=Brevibacillus centrosporus TaxID=54910 RepID=UPI000F0A1B0C|nr:hypothetical protein [Brevibacillus centrosporus]MEC2133457.1 hypothetical protein [Brevibacillus centrosporus]RNB63174.1 hypothetical protein EDM55_29365 [Brevibacillus centrosporus]GED35004.1 hypothetical protein BCE02nite_61450 [Brevibacillus centrosporus]